MIVWKLASVLGELKRSKGYDDDEELFRRRHDDEQLRRHHPRPACSSVMDAQSLASRD